MRMRRDRLVTIVVGLMVGLTLGGCDDNPAHDDPVVRANMEEGEQLGEELGGQFQALMEGQPEPVIVSNAAAVLMALNLGEIEQAQLALDRAARADVRDLAGFILSDHQRNNQELQALLAQRALLPTENVVEQRVRDIASAGLAQLQAVRGEELDGAYLRLQVRLHAAAIEIIDDMDDVIKEGPFFDYLQQTEIALETHLDEAAVLLAFP